MKSNKGFTLIELLVVIAIIGILSSIVLVALNGARNQAKDARIMAGMSQLRTIAEMLYDGDYDDFIVTETDVATIHADIQGQTSGGTGVTIQQDAGEATYCAWADLNEDGNYCVDSTGAARVVADADAVGGCTATTFVCPAS